MLITCPYCGPRDGAEYTYQGDGNRRRPDPASTDQAAWNAYVYDRLNPAGEHREIWQHSGGCRAHLTVTRNTLTHVISEVAFSRDSGPGISNLPHVRQEGPELPAEASASPANHSAETAS